MLDGLFRVFEFRLPAFFAYGGGSLFWDFGLRLQGGGLAASRFGVAFTVQGFLILNLSFGEKRRTC